MRTLAGVSMVRWMMVPNANSADAANSPSAPAFSEKIHSRNPTSAVGCSAARHCRMAAWYWDAVTEGSTGGGERRERRGPRDGEGGCGQRGRVVNKVR